jgi:hypothetical protein
MFDFEHLNQFMSRISEITKFIESQLLSKIYFSSKYLNGKMEIKI